MLVKAIMMHAARKLEMRGWVLRSGGASGADMAFEAGIKDPGSKEIYLPWPRFNGNQSDLYRISQEALDLVDRFHPSPGRLTESARSLLARDGYQVLGPDLNAPSKFVLCWTEGGQKVGGTAHAIRVAEAYGIPVYNLGIPQTFTSLRNLLGPL